MIQNINPPFIKQQPTCITNVSIDLLPFHQIDNATTGQSDPESFITRYTLITVTHDKMQIINLFCLLGMKTPLLFINIH